MIRSKREIKHNLLKRAFEENRGAEVIASIQAILSKVNVETVDDVRILRQFESANYGQPRAVRISNFYAERKGSDIRISDNSIKPSAPSSNALN